LAPLDLIHSDLCEINGIRQVILYYFISMVLLDFVMCIFLKSKYEALHYFKTYKADAKNQLER
jgi:hypothetical protein